MRKGDEEKGADIWIRNRFHRQSDGGELGNNVRMKPVIKIYDIGLEVGACGKA